jgi:hypothetical protein
MSNNRLVRIVATTAMAVTVSIGATLITGGSSASAIPLATTSTQKSEQISTNVGLKNGCKASQRLRLGAGTGYGTNGVVRPGAGIKYLGPRTGAWSRIQVVGDGRIGWIRTMCLTRVR